MAKKKIPRDVEDWIEARRRFRLSHAHVQMARELGMNPRKIGKVANHHQEPWKAPLARFIESLYLKRFGRERPAVVMTVEARATARDRREAARRNEGRGTREPVSIPRQAVRRMDSD